MGFGNICGHFTLFGSKCKKKNKGKQRKRKERESKGKRMLFDKPCLDREGK